ncbi:MAG: hypothetical protein R3A12_19415 [Ignavibacteria bacterium]
MVHIFSVKLPEFDLSYLDSLDINGVTRQVQYSVTNAPTVIGDTKAAIATDFY